MTLSHDDLKNADYSNRIKGGSYPSQSVIGGILLGVLAGPGAASAQKNAYSSLDIPPFYEIQPMLRATVEASHTTVSLADLINKIKHDWSLNMTELAKLMGVQRPTLYNWLKGKTSPDAKSQKHLQTLAAAAADWKESAAGSNWDFLLDYTGPKADELTLRELLGRAEVSTSEIRDMIHTRKKQYQQAHAQSREILGDPVPVKGDPIAKGTRKLNRLWTENSNRLKNAGK